jgi:hypothetical protein
MKKFKSNIQEGTYEYSFDETKGINTVKVYGWPKGNKTPVAANRVLLATDTARDKDDAKMKASRKALEVLNKTYGITEIPSDPYKKGNK